MRVVEKLNNGQSSRHHQNKMGGTNLIYTVIVGVMSSIAIGMYFKVIETFYEIKVYTLLLNIDYFPILKTYKFTEMIEFSFHITVSIIIVFSMIFVMKKLNWTRRQTFWRIPTISVAIGMMIYPTTTLSERTPELLSAIALIHWVIGHFLFGITVAFCIKLFLNRA